MAKLRDCFAQLGVAPINERWAWSARNEETGVVVMTMWQDRFINIEGQPTYRIPPHNEQSKPGFRQLAKDVKYAQEHCGGLVSAIKIMADSTGARTRSIVDCRVLNMKWKVTSFNEATGELIAIPA
jgi:hypothetical protein